MTGMRPEEVAALLDQADWLAQAPLTQEQRFGVVSVSLRSVLAVFDVLVSDVGQLPDEVLAALGYSREVIEEMRNGYVINKAVLDLFGDP